MSKELWESLKEWYIRVPRRWWEVIINVLLTFIPLLVGVIYFIRWAKDATPPLPWWIMALVIGGAILFFAFSFLAFRRVVLERNEARNKLRKDTESGVAYNHRAHVTRVITDDKAEALLRLRDALHDLGELDSRLASKLAHKRIKRAKLVRIQRRLQQDWEVQPSSINENLSRQEIQDTVNQTIKRLGICGDTINTVDEETMRFMIHTAGVLDDEQVGISKQREGDDRYKLVTRLQAKIATDELNNAIKVYVWYSLGMNSMLLLVSYFPAKGAGFIMQSFNKTTTELRAERDQGLRLLLTGISKLIEAELLREEQ
jgi:hypothetical protein